MSVDEVLLCEDGAALPPVVKDDEGLQHCEGVLHLPPYIREGQASVGDEKELTESVHYLPPHLTGVVLLPPGVGGEADQQGGVEEPEPVVELFPISPSQSSSEPPDQRKEAKYYLVLVTCKPSELHSSPYLLVFNPFHHQHVPQPPQEEHHSLPSPLPKVPC